MTTPIHFLKRVYSLRLFSKQLWGLNLTCLHSQTDLWKSRTYSLPAGWLLDSLWQHFQQTSRAQTPFYPCHLMEVSLVLCFLYFTIVKKAPNRWHIWFEAAVLTVCASLWTTVVMHLIHLKMNIWHLRRRCVCDAVQSQIFILLKHKNMTEGVRARTGAIGLTFS